MYDEDEWLRRELAAERHERTERRERAADDDRDTEISNGDDED